MRNIYKLITLVIITLLIPIQGFAIDKNIISGSNPTETAVEISRKWTESETIVLVNSKATSDILCATVLASQISSPILLTEENKLQSITDEEIYRLNPKMVYLIGGEDVISKNIEEQLGKEIKIQRISGKDRYKTSIEVANIINSQETSQQAIIVNGHHSVADTISIAPVAGNKNIPIIISKQQDLEEGEEWIKNNNIETTYIIGGKNVISEYIEYQVSNPKRIGGDNRFDTNSKVIEEFYNNKNIETLFYCKGNEKEEELIEGMIVAPLLAKGDSPIVLVGEELAKSQKEVLGSKNINNLVQVGTGVSEGVKQELDNLKSNIKPEPPKPPPVPPEPPTEPPTEPDSGGTTPELPQDKEAPIMLEYIISEDKKIITLTFDEILNKDITNLKESITIGVRDKVIKLNKYDKVSIDEKKLIIELENGLVAANNDIIIKPNTIMDTNKNYITDPIELKELQGIGKSIAFVSDDSQLQTYMSGKNIADIIKLENNIQVTSTQEMYIKVGNITIDGSNGEDNYKLEGINPRVNYTLNIHRDNVNIKNLDIDNVKINVIDRKGLNFKNLNININKPNTPAITLDHATAAGLDLKLQSKYTGILLTSSIPKVLSARANFIINGLVQNTNGPAIIISNPITEPASTNLNVLTRGTNINNITELFNIEIKSENSYQYEIYTNVSTYQ